MRTKSPETMKQIEDFVNDFFDENLRTPSMREIEAGTGLSRQTASSYLRTMAEQGVLTAAEEVREGFVEVPLSLLGGSDYFALRVYGESMIGAGIQDGDLIVIRKAPHANVGQIVVAIDDEGQTTLKRLAHDGERYYLHPENPEFADIYPDELQIQGVAELMLRDLKH